MSNPTFFVVILLNAALLPACYSHNRVGVDALARLKQSHNPRPFLITGERGKVSRVAPMESLRVGDGQGRWSKSARVADVRVSPTGLYAPSRVHMRWIGRAWAESLGPVEIEALRESKPLYASLIEQPGGIYELVASGTQMVAWLEAFVGRVRAGYIGLRGGYVMAAPKRSRRYGLSRARGWWTFELAPGTRSRRVRSSMIPWHMRRGFRAWGGWRWEQIQSVEVATLHGARTAAAIVGVPAAIATMFGGGLHALAHIIKHEARPKTAVYPPSIIGRPSSDASPLFTRRQVRRSILSLISDFDARLSLDGDTAIVGASIGGRFRELIDMQLGFRAVEHGNYLHTTLTPHPETPPSQTRERRDLRGYYAVFRFGFDFPADARRRFSVPVSVEGGGGTGTFFRVNAGLRYQLTERVVVGAYALNPTRVTFSDSVVSGGAGLWTFQSGVELSLSH